MMLPSTEPASPLQAPRITADHRPTIRNPIGSFVIAATAPLNRMTTRAGLDASPGSTLGVATADFNGDGWLDLYVANDGMANRLWMNQQDGTFQDEALLGGASVNGEGFPEGSMGVDAGDYDNDGDEDLFLAHLTRETNTLYTNMGTGLFTDSSRSVAWACRV